MWELRKEEKDRRVASLRRSLLLAHPAALAYFKYTDLIPSLLPAMACFLLGLTLSALSEGLYGLLAWYDAKAIHDATNDRLNDQLNGVVKEDVVYVVRSGAGTGCVRAMLDRAATAAWIFSGVLFVVGLLIPAVQVLKMSLGS